MDIQSIIKKTLFILAFCTFIANTAMSNDFEKCLTISGENGKGTGFFVKIDDQIYIATNNHVLMGIEEPKIYDSRGNSMGSYIHGNFLSSIDRDIVLLPVMKQFGYYDQINFFEIEKDIFDLDDNEDLTCLGDSEGTGVIVKCTGKLIGIGSLSFETSCPFVPGNSGGPIINTKTGKVIGVATYLKDLSTAGYAQGTRFEKKDTQAWRRFGTRIDNLVLENMEEGTLPGAAIDMSRYRKNLNVANAIAELLEETDDEKDFLINLKAYFSLDFVKVSLPYSKWNTSYYFNENIKLYKEIMSILRKYKVSVKYEDLKCDDYDYNRIIFCLNNKITDVSPEMEYPISDSESMDILRYITKFGTIDQLKRYVMQYDNALFRKRKLQTPSLITCALGNMTGTANEILSFYKEHNVYANKQSDKEIFWDLLLNEWRDTSSRPFFIDEDEAAERKSRLEEDQYLCAKYLLSNNIKPDFNRKKLSGVLSQDFSLKMVKLLIESGAPYSSYTDGDGLSLLHKAVERDNVELVKYYLSIGLNVNAPTKKKHGVIPLHPSNNKKESINFLETFANAFVWYAPKSTPLMFAANSDKPNAFQITKILVEHGANVNLKDEDGKKASERSNNPEIKKYLEKLETKQ